QAALKQRYACLAQTQSQRCRLGKNLSILAPQWLMRLAALPQFAVGGLDINGALWPDIGPPSSKLMKFIIVGRVAILLSKHSPIGSPRRFCYGIGMHAKPFAPDALAGKVSM